MSSFIFNIETLAKELGLDHLPLDKQEEFLGRLEKIISSRINVAVLEKLSDEEQAHFIDLVEAQKETEALDYIKTKISDLPEMIKKISATTLDEFLSLTNKEENI